VTTPHPVRKSASAASGFTAAPRDASEASQRGPRQRSRPARLTPRRIRGRVAPSIAEATQVTSAQCSPRSAVILFALAHCGVSSP
jgi:hypothetical protein